MTIAITGATGQLGGIVVSKLIAKHGADGIVAIARSAEKAADLGVAVRVADYNQPETLAPAFEGIEKLLLISGSEIGSRIDQHKAVIAAAKSAGVKHIVYTSLLNADTSTLFIADEHVQTEEAIKASGLAYTFLRNGWYTENYAASIPGALQGGAYIAAAGDGRISSATREDYAEAAIAALTGTGHEGKTYELAGDTDFTLTDFAAELSKQTGKTIPFQNLSAEEYTKVFVSFGLPEELAKGLALLDVEVSKGAVFSESKELSTLIGRPTTSYADAIKAALA